MLLGAVTYNVLKDFRSAPSAITELVDRAES